MSFVFFSLTLAGCKALQDIGITNISLESLNDAEATAEGSILGTWKYQEFKTKKDPIPTINFCNICDVKDDTTNWKKGVVQADAQNIARRLADTPANHMTPTIFAEEARNVLECVNVKVTVHDQAWAEKERMCAFLAVSKGSAEPPKFLELSYNCGKPGDAPFVLVGKGVTFDSGGISLKPGSAMDEMRADMSGAAAVVAALYALASLNVEANVTALIPLCENMPSGR